MGDDVFKYRVETPGLDEALAKLNTLRAAIVEQSTATKATGTAATEAKGAEDQLLASLTKLTQAIEANADRAKGLADTTKEVGAKSVETTLKIQQFSAGLAQVGSVIGQTNPQLGQMLTHTAALGPMLVEAGRATTMLGSAIAAGPAALTVAMELWARDAAEVEAHTNAIAAAANTAAVDVRQLAAALRDQMAAQADRARIQSGQGTQLEYQAQLNDILARRATIVRNMTENEASNFHGLRDLLGVRDDVQISGEQALYQLRDEEMAIRRRLEGARTSTGTGTIVEQSGGIVDPNSPEGQALTGRAPHGRHGGGRGGAASASPTQSKLTELDALATKEAQIADQEAQRQATEADAREAYLGKQEENEEAQQQRRKDRIAEIEHFEAAQEQRRSRAAAAARQADQQRMQELLADFQSYGASIGGIFNLIADSEGKSAKAQQEAKVIRLVGQGVTEAIQGGIDAAAAAGSAVENPANAVAKGLSSGLHFAMSAKAFVEAGQGGGGGAAAGAGGGGGAPAPTTSRPSPFDQGGAGGPGGTPHTTVINLGLFPGVDHLDTARALGRIMHAGVRVDGRPSWLRAALAA